MPEGDSVHRLARRMTPLTGRRITFCELRVPHLATVDLAGATILGIQAWGKHLYWHLGTPEGSGLVLHTHLRMEGHWVIQAARAHPRPTRLTRVRIRVEGSPHPGEEVELHGQELGKVGLWPREQHASRTSHLGPDPLAEDWHRPGRWALPGREQAIANLTASRGRSLHEALLDQRVLAGVGNEYGNETCFLLGLHPLTRIEQVDATQVIDLVAKLMHENLERVSRTFTGIDREGERTFAFGRNHRPCLRCGTLIVTGTTHRATTIADPRAGRERIIWWCPRCQPSVGS